MDLSDQGGVPRVRMGGEQRVTPLELFFDLLFVFTLTQVTDFLSHQLTWVGVLQAAALLAALWAAWASVPPLLMRRVQA
jgi:low temperature requirement protein LtrA